jgi:hypothetical protein
MTRKADMLKVQVAALGSDRQEWFNVAGSKLSD